MKKENLVALALFLFFITCCQAAGENYPVGCRAAGLANASVSLSDLWSTHHNQAGIAFLKKPGIGTYYENRFLLQELSLKALSAVLPLKQGTFGFSVTDFGYALYRENKTGLSFAQRLNEQFSAGIQLAYYHLSIPGYGKKGALITEAGIQACLLKNLVLGVQLFNINRAKISSGENPEYLPSSIRMGALYSFSKKLLLAGELYKEMRQKLEFRAGLEYMPVKTLSLRTGIATNPLHHSFGFGIQLKQLRLDVASSFHAVLGYSPKIGLIYELN